MGFWPFGGGKKQRSSDNAAKGRDVSWSKNETDIMPVTEKIAPSTPPMTRKTSKTGKDDSLRGLSKNRTSMSTGTSQGHRQSRSVTSPVMSTPLREGPRRPFDEKELYHHTPQSQSSLGPESFSVVRQPPTLHGKRMDYNPTIPRRKSSKRKAEDFAREQEVRAMSSSPIPIPKRPTSFYGGSMLNKETREIPGDLNRKLKRPSSHVSLPIPESLPSLDDAGHQHGFKVGTFAALSPRPTIKYDANPRKASGKQPVRPKSPTVNAIPEEQYSEHLRIDELADDLDAGGLRELMERDRRRRERKKDSDKAKLQRKLQRRADRQKEEEARKARTEEYVKSSAGSDDLQRRQVGDSLEGKDESPGVPGAQKSPTDPFRDPETVQTTKTNIKNPFEDEKEDEDPGGEPFALDDETEPVIPAKSPLRTRTQEQKKIENRSIAQTVSPPVSPAPRPTDGQSMSQASVLNREDTTETADVANLERRASDQSSQRLSSWTNFFKRGSKRTLSSSFRGPGTPSEFSNTSRESFARNKPQPPPIVPPTRSYRRADSATPQRTMSKFREDLPEFPISPPDSRMQSPETSLPPAVSGLAEAATKKETPSVSESGPAESMATASSPISDPISRQEQKWSMELDNPSANPPVEVSQSMASVDSEGSWLSGRPMKRFSGPQQVRKSQSSLRRQPAGYEAEAEGLADDEFLNRLSTAPKGNEDPEETERRRASSGLIDHQQEGLSSPAPEVPNVPGRDDKVTETYHGSVGKQPTIIKQTGRAKSKEGLLQEYQTENTRPAEEESELESPGDESGGEVQEVQLMRAKSVDYKGHARQVSAGSARLLDIRRSSQHMEVSPNAVDASQETTTKPE